MNNAVYRATLKYIQNELPKDAAQDFVNSLIKYQQFQEVLGDLTEVDIPDIGPILQNTKKEIKREEREAREKADREAREKADREAREKDKSKKSKKIKLLLLFAVAFLSSSFLIYSYIYLNNAFELYLGFLTLLSWLCTFYYLLFFIEYPAALPRG